MGSKFHEEAISDYYVYTGQYDDHFGYPQGIGRKIYPYKIVEGQFVKGQLYGFGRVIWHHGSCQIGWYKDGELYGYAKDYRADGTEEEGHFP